MKLPSPMKRGGMISEKLFMRCAQNAVPQASLTASMVPYFFSHHFWKARSASSE